MDSTLHAPKRARSDDDDSGFGPAPGDATPPSSRVKLPRIDGRSASSTDDFSSVVKNKLQSYTRTGQACDRCKVRKIRCDALPEGCSHCLGQNLECNVTDRITGRTERRGYLQELEREKTAMARHIQQLQALLGDQGVEVLPWQWSPYAPVYPSDVILDSKGNVVQDGAAASQWACLGSVWYRRGPAGSGGGGRSSDTPPPSSSATSSLSAASSSAYTPTTSASALQSCPVDSYLGVYADRAPLNSVNGTQVSILGTLLDIDAVGAGVEPEPSSIYREPTGLYNRSLGSFLRSSMNINPPLDSVELPSRSDAFEYSEWYFLMVHPFVPVLHKPTYMTLLTCIYDDPKFQPTTSELVIVHMVFATIYFQYGVRNREELNRQIHLHDLSNKHYHWALNKFYHIASDWSVTAVQALVLITIYTRAFPKPGCGSTIANFALTKAVDLGLHRKSGIPDSETTLANEMRKRAWWIALMFAVTLNGRLGRPMPIRIDDFDTEIPLAIADEYLTEDGITDPSKIGQAPFLVAIHAWKITPLYMEMFSSLYGARRDPRRYGPLVRELERQYDEIQARLPQELHVEACKPASVMYALYAQAVSLEFMLCLHHPSACLTPDPQIFAENTRICEETARLLLRHVQRLLALKSLDTTWYQMSVYCAAMFSTLAAAWERRFKATAAEIELLQDETSIWLSIIAEIGLLAGASDNGQPFNSKLTQICARTIFGILRDMPPSARKAVMAHNARANNSSSSSSNDINNINNINNINHINGMTTANHLDVSAGSSGAVNVGLGLDAAAVAAHGSRHSSSGGESKYSPPGNVDSVALHLETQARLKLEGRLDHGLDALDRGLDQGGLDHGLDHDQMQTAAPLHDHVAPTQQQHSSQYDAGVPVQQHHGAGDAQYVQMPTSYGHHLGMSNGANGGYDHHSHHAAQQQQQQQQHQQQPLMSYPPQHQTGHPPADAAHATATAAMAAANPWTNWTAAIADSQTHDRFTSADALLDLSMLHQRLAPGLAMHGGGAGSGGRGSPADPTAAGGAPSAMGGVVAVGPVPGQAGPMGQIGHHHGQLGAVGGPAQPADIGTHSAQWPLILFSGHVPGV